MPTPITKKGYEALKAELDRLRKVERPRVIEAIAEARSHGDLSENAEYDAAKERQGFIEARIAELESKLADARIIETAGRVSDTVVFGATVVLIEQEAQEKKQYTLVGQDEADLKFSKISVQSPVGRALIGKRVGDFVEVKTPVKVVEYEVVEIRFDELCPIDTSPPGAGRSLNPGQTATFRTGPCTWPSSIPVSGPPADRSWYPPHAISSWGRTTGFSRISLRKKARSKCGRSRIGSTGWMRKEPRSTDGTCLPRRRPG